MGLKRGSCDATGRPTGPPNKNKNTPCLGCLLKCLYYNELLVRKRGLEPPRPCGRQPLKLVRLPIPPLPQVGLLRTCYFVCSAGVVGAAAGAVGAVAAGAAGVVAGAGVETGAAGGGALLPSTEFPDPPC